MIIVLVSLASAAEDLSALSVEELQQTRRVLLDETIPDLETTQDDLSERILQAEVLDGVMGELSASGLEGDLSDLEARIAAVLGESDVADLRDQREQAEADIIAAQRSVERIESRLNTALDADLAEQAFRQRMLAVAAGLIAALVLGFYLLISRDPEIRKVIFSGETGIQFVTMLSLITAIIMFGLMGTLGGPELAALLGGISGYILGKSATPVASAG